VQALRTRRGTPQEHADQLHAEAVYGARALQLINEILSDL
jgi:hypothetical protein